MRSSNPSNILWTPDSRKGESPQLWIAGCSFDDGYALPIDKRYGRLLGKTLKKEVSFLSYSGSSITWAADQLLRSDIREEDIVIWGLTSINRFTAFRENTQLLVWPNIYKTKGNEDTTGEMLKELRAGYTEFFSRNLKTLSTLSTSELAYLEKGTTVDDRILDAVKSVFQVVNFCNKIKAKLIIFYHYLSLPEHEQKFLEYISQLENYKTLSPLVDYAEDKYHPGPLTHKKWSKELIKYIL